VGDIGFGHGGFGGADPNTTHSVSELEARRFAPCTPVQEHSPTA
jgi:hypothetical protein